MAEQISKPYPNYHAARQRDPGDFLRVRVLQTTEEGIMIYGGPLKSDPKGSTKIQTIRFPKDKFSVQRAKDWLKGRDYTTSGFEPASGKSEKASYVCECIECGHTVEAEKHCKDLKCSKCGGQMRRKGRPGPGQKNAEKRDWDTKYINDLPDSAFLYIESGGKKDDENRTKPRNLRHFPCKDSAGKIDLPHLRNAIARIPQSNLPSSIRDSLQANARKLLEAQKKQKSLWPTISERDIINLNPEIGVKGLA